MREWCFEALLEMVSNRLKSVRTNLRAYCAKHKPDSLDYNVALQARFLLSEIIALLNGITTETNNGRVKVTDEDMDELRMLAEQLRLIERIVYPARDTYPTLYNLIWEALDDLQYFVDELERES